MQRNKTWQADLGIGIGCGMYRNPVLFADYSDPDAIRVGDTYYMTASSFNFTPGLPILVSKDLVNWELKNYAVENIPGAAYKTPQHSKGIWAPAIRFHEGKFYIYYGMPDEGIYMVRADDPLGKWDEPVLVLPAKGLIDPCPLWDDDGRAYIVHAYAKSRIGFKSFLGIFEMSRDGTKPISEDHLLFDGTKTQVTIEGPKVYKRNGWYYIFAPAGGVKIGWQTELRSRALFGPYEEYIAMRQGESPTNGPHQGALVDTPEGETWFLHFQDKGAFGRIVHLQPARWRSDDWCVIGREKKGRDWGEPYMFHKKPDLPPSPVHTLEASDDFGGARLKLMWQWLGNHSADFYSLSARPGFLRLFVRNECGRTPAVLWDSPNVLTQKIVCPDMEVKTSVDTSGLKPGGRAGLLTIGGGYAALDLRRNEDGGLTVRYLTSKEKEFPASEQALEGRALQGGLECITLGVDVTVEEQKASGPILDEKDYHPAAVRASFFFETEGAGRVTIGEEYRLSPHTWVGAKVGIYAVSDKGESCGWADFSAFECEGKDDMPEIEFRLTESGDLEAVKYMVEYCKTNMNKRDADGKTFLHHAARSGNLDLVHYLVERVGLSCTDGDKNLVTPFEEARAAGQHEIESYFAQLTGAPLEHMYKNPIRTGMYPDPSIVRVGDDYYMVNSTFVYFPCLPVSHSKDLVNWEIIGYAITDSDWAELGDLEGGRGYWAPDISYSNGRFYITATLRLNDGGRRTRKQMIVSSEKPEGPYSKPAFIDEEGIDPSLFHDDDGRHYMLLNRGARILELNSDLTERSSPARLLWYGDFKKAPEGPHLLKKDGYYYLFLAEGGTGMGHRITLARSKSLDEPFESCPYNPILKQDDPDALIQRCGHGKPVSTPDGRWFIPYLCGRLPDGQHTLLGRETALDELTWTQDGWAVVNGRRHPSMLSKMPFPGTMQNRPWKGCAVLDIKDGAMSLEWMSPRGRREGAVTETLEGVVLRGDPYDLDSLDARNAILRRQTAFSFEARAELNLKALPEGCEADFICYYDERTWLKFGVANDGDGVVCFAEENSGDNKHKTVLRKLEALPVGAKITCRGHYADRAFVLETDGAEAKVEWTARDAFYLCDEGYNQGKRFTGPTLGLFAKGEGAAVIIKSFEYKAEEDAAVLL